ncbi:hypothetical protein Lal_00023511 [Lupinus albus]|nr:hypothetical protein Lal_00023511 [Lupinus albus]
MDGFGLMIKEIVTCNVPLEMRCLVWRIYLDGVPTKLNLVRRRVLRDQDPSQCVFFGVMDESTNHLFFTYSKSYCVWKNLVKMKPKVLKDSYLCGYYDSQNSKKVPLA